MEWRFLSTCYYYLSFFIKRPPPPKTNALKTFFPFCNQSINQAYNQLAASLSLFQTSKFNISDFLAHISNESRLNGLIRSFSDCFQLDLPNIKTKKPPQKICKSQTFSIFHSYKFVSLFRLNWNSFVRRRIISFHFPRRVAPFHFSLTCCFDLFLSSFRFYV